jgi:hypothetical protein
VTDLSRLTDDELEARIRTVSAALYVAPPSPLDSDHARLDDRCCVFHSSWTLLSPRARRVRTRVGACDRRC